MIDNNVKVGSYAEKEFSFSEADVNEYCELTGDNNPLHTDKEYCKMTRFKTPIVPGMQLATLFSMLISDFIPGPGTVYSKQSLSFISYARIDQPLVARIDVLEKNDDEQYIILKTQIKSINKTIVDGLGKVFLPSLFKKRKGR
jgi:acyl dehydratase